MSDPKLPCLLKELGMSQGELARRLGVEPGTVSYWMTGRSGRPLQRYVPAIVAAMDLNDRQRDALVADVVAYEHSLCPPQHGAGEAA